MNDDKRRYRQTKRALKKAGNRKRRRFFERELARNPEQAHEAEFNFGQYTSSPLNGNDMDATRRERGHPPEC